ncbi:hypothetical protein D3C86_1157670 [compost metagenome]
MALGRLAGDHFLRRGPARPLRFAGHLVGSGPFETGLADADAVTPGLAIGEHEIEEAVRRIDDDGAGLLSGVIAHDLRQELRRDLGAHRRVGAYGGILHPCRALRCDAGAGSLRHGGRLALLEQRLACGRCARIDHGSDIAAATELGYPGGGKVRADDDGRTLAITLIGHGGRDGEGGNEAQRQKNGLHRHRVDSLCGMSQL